MSFKQPRPQPVTLLSLSPSLPLSLSPSLPLSLFLSLSLPFRMTQKADNADLSESGRGLWLAVEQVPHWELGLAEA